MNPILHARKACLKQYQWDKDWWIRCASPIHFNWKRNARIAYYLVSECIIPYKPSTSGKTRYPHSVYQVLNGHFDCVTSKELLWMEIHVMLADNTTLWPCWGKHMRCWFKTKVQTCIIPVSLQSFHVLEKKKNCIWTTAYSIHAKAYPKKTTTSSSRGRIQASCSSKNHV